MNRTLIKNLLTLKPKECHRSYAIMTRAKHRAGIPVSEAPKPKKIQQTTTNKELGPEQKAQLQARLQNLHFRKPAGINERLVKVTKEIVQPENPHLIKVAVIGAANAGKSTLVNKIVGEEISGVSPKAHTTRERILAVLSENNHQVVFLDTPGVIPDHNHAKMNRTLSTSSWRALDEADHVLVVVDAGRSLQPKARVTEDFLLERLKDLNIPATLIFNKMDLIYEDRESLSEVQERYVQGYTQFKNTLHISAVYEEGLTQVKNILFEHSTAKPWIYPVEQKTEMADLKRVEEMIRIQFFKRLHQYIPYMLKQENAGWTVLKDGTLRIDQNVYVERDSQQKIVVGTNGRIINSVVEEARDQISKAFNRPVKLFLQVKTRKNNISNQ
ncbi:P-loop containing nucleoside triphosphate hydrolase protein [Mucor mucedo]|uniref:P-loop containing nucleoside triphosphate hydrolase protein n=1 Tax=Mucor mucedo TaxID=29922 RepID=UPI00221EDB67|nr:P-loop containing nucleoside triphosphate hydrolase protein [Mucor mucedo]KAI7893215.1 P-loop containing nucleoside triphosphate hydrolase protein [Mucor mucedo]